MLSTPGKCYPIFLLRFIFPTFLEKFKDIHKSVPFRFSLMRTPQILLSWESITGTIIQWASIPENVSSISCKTNIRSTTNVLYTPVTFIWMTNTAWTGAAARTDPFVEMRKATVHKRIAVCAALCFFPLMPPVPYISFCLYQWWKYSNSNST